MHLSSLQGSDRFYETLQREFNAVDFFSIGKGPAIRQPIYIVDEQTVELVVNCLVHDQLEAFEVVKQPNASICQPIDGSPRSLFTIAIRQVLEGAEMARSQHRIDEKRRILSSPQFREADVVQFDER